MKKRNRRSKKRRNTNKPQAHFSLIGYFLNEMYPLLTELEQQDKIAIEHHLPGVVISHNIWQLYQSSIVEHVLQMRRKYGDMKTVMNAFKYIDGFAAEHNPYKEFATFLQWCKMMCALRIGREAGEQNVKLEFNPEEKFFFTVMKEDLSEPSHIGYEQNGEVMIEEYIQGATEVTDTTAS